MIGKLLSIIKDDLEAYFVAKGRNASGVQNFAFPNIANSGGSAGSILTEGRLNLLLVNIEENRSHRPADMWHMADLDGSTRAMHPPVKLDIFFLIASKYADYPTALDNLTLCIQYFLAHRYFDRHQHQDFPTDVDKVIVEMIPMTFEVQRAVWTGMQLPYLPSALFRMGLIVVTDDEAQALMPSIRAVQASALQLP